MNHKLILCLALVLSGCVLGCSTINERPAAMSNATAVGTYISEIHMIDARNGWAWSSGDQYSNLLQNTLLLHTSNGGQTWQDRTPRTFPYTTGGSCFLNSQTAWVSTLDRKTYVGGLLHTTDGGKSWSVLIKQGTASYGCLTEASDCHFFNANDGVANTADYSAGSVDVCFYETHDGGKNWKPVVVIPPGGRYANERPGTIGLSDIAPESMGYCPPVSVVITHGDMEDERPKDAVRLSITSNLGEIWRDVKLPLPSKMYRDGLVECDDPVFLDGKNGWLPVRILKRNADESVAWNVLAFFATDDSGETWTSKPGIIEGGTNFVGSYQQLDIVSFRDIFVCNGANLYVTHDGAKNWRAIKPNIDQVRPSRSDTAKLASLESCFLIHQCPGACSGVVYFDRTSSHGGVLQIDFVDAAHGWAVVYDTFKDFPHDKYYLYKTSDGGKRWMELPLKIVL